MKDKCTPSVVWSYLYIILVLFKHSGFLSCCRLQTSGQTARRNLAARTSFTYLLSLLLTVVWSVTQNYGGNSWIIHWILWVFFSLLCGHAPFFRKEHHLNSVGYVATNMVNQCFLKFCTAILTALVTCSVTSEQVCIKTSWCRLQNIPEGILLSARNHTLHSET